MSQEVSAPEVGTTTTGDEHSHGGTLLGPLLCWAVVFADIGTSIYYVPGILYGNVGNLAGFFVLLTMSVFVLLTLKYAEVTHRYPQGGGVVTVAASAMNKWFGALGGMFILVDYFLTASISCLSGMQYLSVVIPVLSAALALPVVGSIQLTLLLITIGVLVLLGILNWYGISESAKVSLVGAIIAFISDIAILITVFTHISLSEFFGLFPRMFTSNAITPISLLIGFAGSFLAFSGLESISQLSPVMKTPRKKVAGIALFLVVITIGVTSPLLTMFSTLLQPTQAKDPVLSAQLISLLGGHWGNIFLQTEIAISASALLVFASNTAIIGAYHVFIALSRLGFFPSFVLTRNRLRNTPHYSIMLATGIPIVILVAVLGNITILGDMYAFGLLGAFTLTCLGLDIVRVRERKAERMLRERQRRLDPLAVAGANGSNALQSEPKELAIDLLQLNENAVPVRAPVRISLASRVHRVWQRLDFWLGVLTTGLVILAWTTNLVAKPLATAFGGVVTVIGMGIAYFNYRRQEQIGLAPVHVVPLSHVALLPDATLAVLLPGEDRWNSKVIQAAANHGDGNPLIFLYIGKQQAPPTVEPFEFYEPYLSDEEAVRTFGKAQKYISEEKKVKNPQFLYQPIKDTADPQKVDIVKHVWRTIHPHELLIAAEDVSMLEDINPDRIRYEITPKGRVAHLLVRR